IDRSTSDPRPPDQQTVLKMATSLLDPPTRDSPQTTLKLSQSAPTFIKSQTSTSTFALPYPLSLFSNSESLEKWSATENLFLATLRSGDNDSAYALLESLTDRFGLENERIAALRGLWAEATAKTPQELVDVLKDYEEILKEDPSNFAIRKRRCALLRSMGQTEEALNALTNFVDTSPTDAEGWSELGSLYEELGMHEQAIFCLEEVLLLMPNAWNMQAKIGEVLYMSASQKQNDVGLLGESMRRFCRSIELCDDYLRGYFGLKICTTRLLEVLGTTKKGQPADGELPLPKVESVRKLNQVATAKLAEIVRRVSAGEKGWDGYNEAEIAAAKELLARETQKIER
ncbi:TPR repeat protein oca3, partial [Pseudocercospora fuligena]